MHEALASSGEAAAPPPEPAVPIGKSVTPNHIVCLEDGKKLKMLRRHLRTAYDMSPEEYREKWGLKPDYPMVAPAYAKFRSELARSIGLGKKHRKEKPRFGEGVALGNGPHNLFLRVRLTSQRPLDERTLQNTLFL